MIALLVGCLHAPPKDPAPTEWDLEGVGMQFQMPEGFWPVAGNENLDMSWEHAIGTRGLEVRYAIRPLQSAMEVLDIDPDAMELLSRAFVLTTTLNISNGTYSEIEYFPALAVREEFGADWGSSVIFTPREPWGGGWKQGLYVHLHKAQVADAYVFFMLDDYPRVREKVDAAFYALRFK